MRVRGMNDYSGDPNRIEHELAETRARLRVHDRADRLAPRTSAPK